MVRTSRGSLIVTDRTLTATDYDGSVHYLLRKSKNDDSSRCIHVDSLLFHFVTFHDHEETLSPFQTSASVTTSAQVEDFTLRRQMMQIFRRLFNETELYFECQQLWEPLEVRELRGSLSHRLASQFFSMLYAWDAFLADYFPLWLFWDIRNIPFIAAPFVFILQILDAILWQSKIHETVCMPLLILLDIILETIFFLNDRYLFLPHELRDQRTGFFFRVLIGF